MPVIDDPRGYNTGSKPSGGWAPDRAINDAFARQLEAKAGKETKGIQNLANKPKPRTLIQGPGQIRRAWDETPGEHVYHFSPEENFKRGIQAEGLKSNRAKGHSAGVHFSPDPDYPIIGGEPDSKGWNAYRVKKSDIPELKYRSSADFYSESDIHPSKVKVYTGTGAKPRWSGLNNAYNTAQVPLMLANIANMGSGMLGGPMVMTPLDNVLMQLLEKNRQELTPTMEEKYGAGDEPEYHSLGRGRGRRKPTTYGPRYYYDEQGNMLA